MVALLDTNVLLRLAEPGHVQYPVALGATTTLAGQGQDLVIVSQNVYEFWSAATRPTSANGLGRTATEAAAEVARFTSLFRLLPDDPAVISTWLRLVTSTPVLGKNAHDARLVAAMHVHGIDHILTFNDSDFRRFTGITVLTPAGVLNTP